MQFTWREDWTRIRPVITDRWMRCTDIGMLARMNPRRVGYCMSRITRLFPRAVEMRMYRAPNGTIYPEYRKATVLELPHFGTAPRKDTDT